MKRFIILALSSAFVFSTSTHAKTVEKTTCYIFKNNHFKEKKSCTITDWQTLGDAYTNEYFIKGYGKFESYGGLDHDTLEEYKMLGEEAAIGQTRLKSNFRILKNIDFGKFDSKIHLSCHKQIKTGFEICR